MIVASATVTRKEKSIMDAKKIQKIRSGKLISVLSVMVLILIALSVKAVTTCRCVGAPALWLKKLRGYCRIFLTGVFRTVVCGRMEDRASVNLQNLRMHSTC
jgi:hypothetical protein